MSQWPPGRVPTCFVCGVYLLPVCGSSSVAGWSLLVVVRALVVTISDSGRMRWRRRDGEPIDASWLQSDGSLQLPASISSVGSYQCLAENIAGTAMSNFTVVHCTHRCVLNSSVSDSVTQFCLNVLVGSWAL